MTDTPFAVTKREDLSPVCPHCSHELTEVYVRTQGLGWIEGKNIVYFCSACRKVLGFGQSRMV